MLFIILQRWISQNRFWRVLLIETVGCYVMLLFCYVVMLCCYVFMLLCCFLFRCDKCEKYYPPKYLATRHILVHQEGKNFKCKVCEKSFKTPENLKVEHILIIAQTSKLLLKHLHQGDLHHLFRFAWKLCERIFVIWLKKKCSSKDPVFCILFKRNINLPGLVVIFWFFDISI